MAEQDFYEEEVQQEDQGARNPVRARMRELENEVKSLRQMKDEAEAAKKELAFVKAGIDLNSPMSKYFVKGYDGEISPDAIRAAAAEANLIQTAPSEQQVPKQEQAAWNRMGNAAAMGDVSEPVVDYAAKIASAKNEREVMELLAQAKANQSNII